MEALLNWGGPFLREPLDFTRLVLTAAMGLTAFKALVTRRWFVLACFVFPLLHWLDLTVLGMSERTVTLVRVGVNVGWTGIVARIYLMMGRSP